ncbi:MAG: DUF4349 domain-containing protein [Cytophagales bacterium]|nr:DUF4349 domain-containing protein [Cytophagales bacterium]MDW8383275.1 DUF4349 domain-containing protein [Flammeovirgaceae bacterium]
MRVYIISGLLLLLHSCNSSSPESSSTTYTNQAQKNIEEEKKNDETHIESSSSEQYLSSQITSQNLLNAQNRKFIRTAEIRMRVKDVYQYSLEIENIVMRMGGFVIYTQLRNSQDYTQTIPISKDSVVEITYYTVNNDITTRIPVNVLDSALRLLVSKADYLDYRTIRAEDVTLRELSNQLTIKRSKKADKRPEREEERDQAIIDNLRLEDEINYATLNISVYQRQTQIRQTLPNIQPSIKEYEPSYFSKLKDAFLDSFRIIGEAVLFLVRIWLLLILFVALYWGYRKWWKKF